MYICYLDESGTPEPSASTTHFVLLGVAISADRWREHDREISAAKSRYGLDGSEIHTAWLLRDYPEQERVDGFSGLSFADRRRAVIGVRSMNLSRPRTNAQQRELLKNYRHTADYVHLGRGEREVFTREVAGIVASWDDAVLFADAHDKTKAPTSRAFDIAFEQVVTRFNTFLGRRGQTMGLIVQDNNPTIANRLTANMQRYHRNGTIWSSIDRIVETPLFVDSQLTSMVQIADLCAYAIRRFCERAERDLYDRIALRVDKDGGRLVGIRHYTGRIPCQCEICIAHGRPEQPSPILHS